MDIEKRLAERFGSLEEAKKSIDMMFELMVQNPNPNLNEEENTFLVIAMHDIRVAIG